MTEIPSTMSAVVATPGRPQRTTRRDDVPVPTPADDEALIAVEAFALNRGELTLLRTRHAGWIPGQDVAGTVVRAAAGGSGPAEGTKVVGLAEWHGWAQYVNVPAHRLAVRPDAVSAAHAAALPMAGTTALGVLEAYDAPLLGRRVLVTGAAGGVGRFAVQLAAIGGARVTAVSRRTDGLRELGAHDVREALADAPADGNLHDLVLESVGGTALTHALAHAAHGGTVVSFGASSGEPAPYTFFALGGREVNLRAYFSGRHERRAGERLAFLVDLTAQGRLDPGVGHVADWSEVNAMLDALERRAVAGKAVLTVG